LNGESVPLGTFIVKTEATPTLDINDIGIRYDAHPPVSFSRKWHVILRDNKGTYDTTVDLATKRRHYIESCPIWVLIVNGQTSNKDTEGWGGWSWDGELSVFPVKLIVHTDEKPQMHAQVFISR